MGLNPTQVICLCFFHRIGKEANNLSQICEIENKIPKRVFILWPICLLLRTLYCFLGGQFPLWFILITLYWMISSLLLYSGLFVFPSGPLNMERDSRYISELFRPFQGLLLKIKWVLFSWRFLPVIFQKNKTIPFGIIGTLFNVTGSVVLMVATGCRILLYD